MDSHLSESAWARGRADFITLHRGPWFWVAEVFGAGMIGLVTESPFVGLVSILALMIAVWAGATLAAPTRQRNDARGQLKELRARLESRPTLDVIYDEPELGQNRPPYGFLEIFDVNFLAGRHVEGGGQFAFQRYRVGVHNTSDVNINGVYLELTSMPDVNNAYLPTPLRVRFTDSQSTVDLAPSAQEFFDVVSVNLHQPERPDFAQSIL